MRILALGGLSHIEAEGSASARQRYRAQGWQMVAEIVSVTTSLAVVAMRDD